MRCCVIFKVDFNNIILGRFYVNCSAMKSRDFRDVTCRIPFKRPNDFVSWLKAIFLVVALTRSDKQESGDSFNFPRHFHIKEVSACCTWLHSRKSKTLGYNVDIVSFEKNISLQRLKYYYKIQILLVVIKIMN